MALTHAPSPLRLLLGRSVPRLALVLIPIAFAAILLLLTGPSIDGRAPAAAYWLLLALLLALFWWSVVLLTNSFRISAESSALILVSAWVALTLILPPLIAAISQAANPPPSRFAQIAASRAAEIQATSAFENDHPELTDAAAERRRQAERAIGIDRDIEAAVRPVSEAFERQRARQRSTTTALSFLSPPLVAGNVEAAVAGTDGATWSDFRRAAGDYLRAAKTALGEIILAEQPFTAETYRDLPRFAWSPARRQPIGAILYLALLSALIGGIAVRRFRRISLV